MNKVKSWPMTKDWKDTYPAIQLPPKNDDLVVASVMFIQNTRFHAKLKNFMTGRDKTLGVINFNTEITPIKQVESLIMSWYILSSVIVEQSIIYVYFIDCCLFYEISVDKEQHISALERITVDEEELIGKIVFLTTRVRLPQLTGIWTRYITEADLPDVKDHSIIPCFQKTVRALTIPALIDKAPSAFQYGLWWYKRDYAVTENMLKMISYKKR